MSDDTKRWTPKDLDHAVRQYPTYELLGRINRIGVEEDGASEISKLFPGPAASGHKSPVFTQNGLAFVARQAIVHSNDHRGDTPTWQNVAQLCSIYNNLDDPLLDAPPGDRDALIQFLVRTAYEQFPLQGNIRYLFSRALHLFDIIPRDLTATRHAFDMESVFRTLVGLGVREFLQYGFLLWVVSTKQFPLSSLKLMQYGVHFSFFSQRGLSDFLAHVSCDYAKFREAARREEDGISWSKQCFNSLWQWPIVRPQITALGDYLVPVPRLLLERVTNGLYHDFLNTLVSAETRGQFLTFLGDVFQEYVGRLLQPYYGPDELFAEIPYGQGQKTVDWMLVEGETAILLECKSKRFTKVSKRVAARDDLARDLRLAIVVGASQLFGTQQAILGRAQGLERFQHVRQVLPILVVSEPLYLANTPFLRQLVLDDLKSVGVENFDFQIVSVPELEFVLPWRSHSSISDLLSAKFQSADVRSWDLGAFLREGPDPRVGHKLLDATLDAFVESLGATEQGPSEALRDC